MRHRDIQPGDIVYDLSQADAPMVVVDHDLPTVGRLGGAAGDAVRSNYANDLVGYDADTPCASAVYATIDSEPSRTYTFPITRLARPRIELANDVKGTGAELAQWHFLDELLAEAADVFPDSIFQTLVSAVRETSLPDEIVEYASHPYAPVAGGE